MPARRGGVSAYRTARKACGAARSGPADHAPAPAREPAEGLARPGPLRIARGALAFPARHAVAAASGARALLARGAPALRILAAAAALAAGLAPGPAASRPDDVGWIESRQVVELFSDSCLHFAGPDRMRAWLTGQGYRRMPPGQEQELLRAPGRGYDASTRTGHQALLSRDDGWCIAVAENVDAGRLVALLEQRLRLSGVSYRPVGDADPPDRGYTVEHGSHRSLLLVRMTRLDDRLQGSLLLAPME